jgi:hypothetical protein
VRVEGEVWLIRIIRVKQFWLDEQTKSACPASRSFRHAGS